MSDRRPGLEDPPVPTKLRLSLLWTSLMFLYIYNDYFSLYVPHTIEQMSKGILGPLGPATQAPMVGVSLLLAIPALMIVLSTALPAPVSRPLNLVFGLAYTLVEVPTLLGTHVFYTIVVAIEIVLTLLITWIALRWPKTD